MKIKPRAMLLNLKPWLKAEEQEEQLAAGSGRLAANAKSIRTKMH